jgi:hypothetical protein
VFTAKDRKEWCGSKRKKNKKKRVHGFTGITTNYAATNSNERAHK